MKTEDILHALGNKALNSPSMLIKNAAKIAHLEDAVIEFCTEDVPRKYTPGSLFRWMHEDVSTGANTFGSSYQVTCKVCCASLAVSAYDLHEMLSVVAKTVGREPVLGDKKASEQYLQLIALKNLLSVREYQQAILNLLDDKPPYPPPPIKLNLK